MHKPTGSDHSAATKDEPRHRPYLLYNKTLPEAMVARLEEDFLPIPLPEDPDLPFPVSYHPDMLVFYFGGKIVTTANYYSSNRDLFNGLGAVVTAAENRSVREYPGDVLLNALPAGGLLFAKTDSVSEKIKELFGNDRIVDVKQGYAACSCCRVGDKALITADRGIAKAASDRGIDVLGISPGSVMIDSYPYGFIGGASFCYKDAVYFFGDVDRHPDSVKIKEFIRGHGMRTISLSDCELFDFGGAIPL